MTGQDGLLHVCKMYHAGMHSAALLSSKNSSLASHVQQLCCVYVELWGWWLNDAVGGSWQHVCAVALPDLLWEVKWVVKWEMKWLMCTCWSSALHGGHSRYGQTHDKRYMRHIMGITNVHNTFHQLLIGDQPCAATGIRHLAVWAILVLVCIFCHQLWWANCHQPGRNTTEGLPGHALFAVISTMADAKPATICMSPCTTTDCMIWQGQLRATHHVTYELQLLAGGRLIPVVKICWIRCLCLIIHIICWISLLSTTHCQPVCLYLVCVVGFAFCVAELPQWACILHVEVAFFA